MTTKYREYVDRYDDTTWKVFIYEAEKVAESSSKVYVRYMARYLEDRNLTPDDFFNEIKDFQKLNANASPDTLLKLQEYKIQVQDYYESKLKEGYKASTLNNWYNGIVCFLKGTVLLNDNMAVVFKPIINARLRLKYPEAFETHQVDIAEREHVRKMVTHSGNPRMVSQILTLRDTGLRVSDIRRIQIKHILPILEDSEREWYNFILPPQKNMGHRTMKNSHPCLGYEAVEALRVWLAYLRDHFGISLDNPEQHVYCMIQNKNRKHVGDQQGEGSIGRQIRYVREKAGIEEQITAHSFRHMNTTYLGSGGMDSRWIEFAQGKRGHGSLGTYVRPPLDLLMEKFQKAYHAIAMTTPTQEQMQQTIEELESSIEKLGESNEMIQHRMNLMNKAMSRGATSRKNPFSEEELQIYAEKMVSQITAMEHETGINIDPNMFFGLLDDAVSNSIIVEPKKPSFDNQSNEKMKKKRAKRKNTRESKRDRFHRLSTKLNLIPDQEDEYVNLLKNDPEAFEAVRLLMSKFRNQS